MDLWKDLQENERGNVEFGYVKRVERWRVDRVERLECVGRVYVWSSTGNEVTI